MKRLTIAIMLSIGISSVAIAMGGKHGQRFDWEELDLTDKQEEQIKVIKEGYREQFHSLRKSEGDTATKKQDMYQLRQDMIAEVRLVLTPEQQLEASTLIIEKMEKRIAKRMNRLHKKLDLTPEQKESLQQVLSVRLAEVKERLKAGDVPEFSDKQKMFQQLDQVMPTILSTEQLEQWQKVKEKRAKHFAHHQSKGHALTH